MLLSSSKFSSKADEVLQTKLDRRPLFLHLEKFQGNGPRQKVELGSANPGSAGMMLYTSGTTNRPVRLLPPPQKTNANNQVYLFVLLTMHDRKEYSCRNPS
jgi:malonyl-CoA/methylmalonyl-CoA synthetase